MIQTITFQFSAIPAPKKEYRLKATGSYLPPTSKRKHIYSPDPLVTSKRSKKELHNKASLYNNRNRQAIISSLHYSL